MLDKTVLKTASVLALGMAGLLLGSCSEKPAESTDAPKEITFSVLSFEKSQNLDRMWAPIFADMEKQTGLKIKPFYSSNYTALVEAMRFNQVQAGFFSSSSGLDAMKRATGEVFAHTTNPDGTDGYQSIIIARADSKLTLDDVLKCDHKLNFGIGDVKSASGTIIPKVYLFMPHKIDTDNCFRSIHSGSHQNNVEGVVAGVYDAATANTDTLKELNDTPEGQVKAAKLKVLWSSAPIPKGVIEYRSDLNPVVKEKLRSFFLSYGQGTGPEAERQRANLKVMQWGPMQPADASYLATERFIEATAALAEAQKGGDAGKIAKAQSELDEAKKAQAAAASSVVPQAPADAPSSAQ
jgi:phosphonate transport system substrate-binding protein